MDYFDLTGRSALVTGAAGGIGSAAATALAEAGAAVLVTDLDKDAAAAVAERISAAGGRAESAALDVSDRDSADAAAAQAALAATPMTETIRTNEKFAAIRMNRIPMKRWAEPVGDRRRVRVHGPRCDVLRHRPGAAGRRRHGYVNP